MAPILQSLVTLDDVKLDGGGGSVVRPALVLAAVAGPNGLKEEGDHGHLGLVHQQTDSRLVGGHLGTKISQYPPSLSECSPWCCYGTRPQTWGAPGSR